MSWTRSAVLGEPEGALEGALRVAEPAQGELHVGERDRAAEHVGDVPGPLGPAMAPCSAVRGLDVARASRTRGRTAPPRPRGPGRRPRPPVEARSACAMAPAGSPPMRASAARYISRRRAPGRARRGRPRPARRRAARAGARRRRRRSRDAVEVVAGHQAADQAEGQDRAVADTSSGSASAQPRITASRRSRRSVRDGELDQVRGPLDVAGGQRVPDRLLGLAGVRVPRAGPPVQLGDLGRAARRAGARAGRRRRGGGSGTSGAGRRAGRGKVPALQRLEHLAAPGRLGDGVAERAGEPVEDRRAEQEVADVVGLAVEHLLDEVVDDEPVVAGEPGDERATGRPGPAARARPAAGRRSSPRCGRRARRRRARPARARSRREERGRLVVR